MGRPGVDPGTLGIGPDHPIVSVVVQITWSEASVRPPTSTEILSNLSLQGRTRAPRVVAAVGQSFTHPGVREVSQDRAQEPRAHPGGDRAQPLELETRGTQLKDPSHQPPRLRAPLGRSDHRHDLPLLRWPHDRTTNDEPRRVTKITHTNPRRTSNLSI